MTVYCRALKARVHISKHAEERYKERFGAVVGKDTLESLVKKAERMDERVLKISGMRMMIEKTGKSYVLKTVMK